MPPPVPIVLNVLSSVTPGYLDCFSSLITTLRMGIEAATMVLASSAAVQMNNRPAWYV